jgi:hypothetical protein
MHVVAIISRKLPSALVNFSITAPCASDSRTQDSVSSRLLLSALFHHSVVTLTNVVMLLLQGNYFLAASFRVKLSVLVIECMEMPIVLSSHFADIHSILFSKYRHCITFV